jgi:predicted transcriptional regulator
MLGYFRETKAMSISIELKPEVEELLEQEAKAKGISVESYVEELIEQQVSQPHKTSHIGSEEIDRALDSLAEGSDDRPVLQPEAYTRESIYQDHN